MACYCNFARLPLRWHALVVEGDNFSCGGGAGKYEKRAKHTDEGNSEDAGKSRFGVGDDGGKELDSLFKRGMQAIERIESALSRIG